MQFRKVLTENSPSLIPKTVFKDNMQSIYTQQQWVFRPRRHAQGRNLWVTQSDGLQRLFDVHPDGYASELINKVAEYRVYVVSGRVATVAEKTPENPDAVAWNVAQGGRFDVVRWGSWPLEVCRVAIEAMSYSGLDFGGVDVMVDREGRAYCIEINSAPSLPLLSDGSVSYRQKCMAKCFAYGRDNIPEVIRYSHWSDVIHPAVA